MVGAAVLLTALLAHGGHCLCPRVAAFTSVPAVVLEDVPFALGVGIEWRDEMRCAALQLHAAASARYNVTSRGRTLVAGEISLLTNHSNALASFRLDGLQLSSSGASTPLLIAFESGTAVACCGASSIALAVRVIPPWLSFLPPVVTLGLALLMRHVLFALVAGVCAGATLLSDFNPLVGALRTFDTHLVGAMADSSHASVIVFTLFLGGMVTVAARGGGTAGLAQVVISRARPLHPLHPFHTLHTSPPLRTGGHLARARLAARPIGDMVPRARHLLRRLRGRRGFRTHEPHALHPSRAAQEQSPATAL